MDHHLKCVARVLGRLSAIRDLKTEKIDLGDLQGATIDEGFIDRVEHIPSEPNDVGLEGLFYKRKFDNGKKTMAVICYDKRLHEPNGDEPKRRFIVAKELSHVFDQDGELTSTPAEIDALMSGMISKPVLGGTGAAIKADYNARLLAIEMLIPFERRKLLMAQPVTGATVLKLANDCGMPVEYARIALDPKYESFIGHIRKKAKISDIF